MQCNKNEINIILESKMNKNKPLVVVMSRNYSTGLSIIRSLGIEGYPVDLIASANRTGQSATIAGSKYINNMLK